MIIASLREAPGRPARGAARPVRNAAARRKRLRAEAALALAGLALAGCGGSGDPVCGDGHTDPGEQCDDGNDDETDFCRACTAWLPPRTTVQWRFNAEAAEGFTQDGCIDLGVQNVQVDLTGASAEVSATAACSTFQVVFEELPPGPYLARVRPLGAGDAALTSLVEQQITAEDRDTTHRINVPPEAWTNAYTGSYFFAVRWGGFDCGDADPPITQQVITLIVGGQVVSQQTTTGQRLDGSLPGPCVPASTTEHAALAVPFGRGTIEIVGQDDLGDEHFHGAFDTFVGAGPSNPTLEYDVQTIHDAPPPDAELPDAMPDAGP